MTDLQQHARDAWERTIRVRRIAKMIHGVLVEGALELSAENLAGLEELFGLLSNAAGEAVEHIELIQTELAQ